MLEFILEKILDKIDLPFNLTLGEVMLLVKTECNLVDLMILKDYHDDIADKVMDHVIAVLIVALTKLRKDMKKQKKLKDKK